MSHELPSLRPWRLGVACGHGGKSLLFLVISKYLKNFVLERNSHHMLKQIKDEYQVLSELGTGGMATIYKAIQKTLDRPVAIKELKKAYHADEQIVQRFEREAKMSASFQHENIVHIYDYWKKPDFCIVMEYVDGTDLADIIEKTGSVPVDVGIMIAIQVCSALDYAHMRGLIHRDIKPSNIMVKRNGEVKLMDFGIAHTKKLQTLTLPGTFLGTPAYMSPEQILGQSLDNQSDIFSLGIVLYEMFTGIKPFQDEETHSVTAKILKDRFLPPRRLNSDIPRRLQRVIKKCLKKKTAKRYQSVLDLARALGKRLVGTTNKSASLKRISDYLVEVKVFAAPPENETMVITKVPPGRLFKRLLVAAAVILTLAAGAAAYSYWKSGQQAVSPPAPLPIAPQPAAAPPKTLAPPAEQRKEPETTVHKKTKSKKKKTTRNRS
jgi:serine/threonine protein kinase